MPDPRRAKQHQDLRSRRPSDRQGRRPPAAVDLHGEARLLRRSATAKGASSPTPGGRVRAGAVSIGGPTTGRQRPASSSSAPSRWPRRTAVLYRVVDRPAVRSGSARNVARHHQRGPELAQRACPQISPARMPRRASGSVTRQKRRARWSPASAPPAPVRVDAGDGRRRALDHQRQPDDRRRRRPRPAR